MGLTVVIGICIATVFQKLDSKAFFNWKRKVIKFTERLTSVFSWTRHIIVLPGSIL